VDELLMSTFPDVLYCVYKVDKTFPQAVPAVVAAVLLVDNFDRLLHDAMDNAVTNNVIIPIFFIVQFINLLLLNIIFWLFISKKSTIYLLIGSFGYKLIGSLCRRPFCDYTGFLK
jgi:hypothetical protein